MTRFWRAREFSTAAILLAEILFFAWYLWPDADRSHPFLNGDNFLLILKYSSIYGIATIGAAVVIISGGVDLAPGAVIGLTTVVMGYLFVEAGWPLWAVRATKPSWPWRPSGSWASWPCTFRPCFTPRGGGAG